VPLDQPPAKLLAQRDADGVGAPAGGTKLCKQTAVALVRLDGLELGGKDRRLASRLAG
jgi:hypothetical protein